MDKKITVQHIDQLANIFANLGVESIYVKFLSEKQDNSKNQIYLGSHFGKDLGNIPGFFEEGRISESTAKRKSKKTKPKFLYKLNFYWITADGKIFHAPYTQIIDYFQYPEIRLSGFLKGCENPPDALRKEKQHVYGKRILCFGVGKNEKIYGIVLTEKDDPLTLELCNYDFDGEAVLKKYNFDTKEKSSRHLLLEELGEICGDKCYPSIRLKPREKEPIPFKGNQGAGYTLEALLEIPSNASKEGDKYGYEIKTLGDKGIVSLMTPTADLFFEGADFREFLAKYGWQGRRHSDRIVFNGKFLRGKEKNGFTLHLNGYDPESGSISDNLNEVYVFLEDQHGEKVSGWSFGKIASAWIQKHNRACYVPYQKCNPSNQYRFSNEIILCERTNYRRLLEAIYSGEVFYDPGHEIKDGIVKNRPQWRFRISNDFKSLNTLYESVEVVDLKNLN